MATDAASILSIALQVVSTKVILLLALGINAGLYFWAMWYHAWIPLVIAASFSVLVFMPVLLKGDFRAKDHSSQ